MSISVSLAAVSSGNAGVLRLSDGYQTLPAGTVTIDDANRVLQITFAAGYTLAEAAAVLSTLRFVNTDTASFMDSSNRTVTITITDQNGNSATAVASGAVSGDTTDLAGAAGINAFTGGANSDRIVGLDGDDVLDGGSGGDDIIDGGADDDTIIAANGNNQLLGGTGDNTITAGNGNNTVTAADGDNTITLGNGVNQVTLGNGDNTVTAGDGGNTIASGAGDDVITTGQRQRHHQCWRWLEPRHFRRRQRHHHDRDRRRRHQQRCRQTTGSSQDAGDDDITTGTGSDTIVYNSTLAQIGFETLRDFESGVDTPRILARHGWWRFGDRWRRHGCAGRVALHDGGRLHDGRSAFPVRRRCERPCSSTPTAAMPVRPRSRWRWWKQAPSSRPMCGLPDRGIDGRSWRTGHAQP